MKAGTVAHRAAREPARWRLPPAGDFRRAGDRPFSAPSSPRFVGIFPRCLRRRAVRQAPECTAGAPAPLLSDRGKIPKKSKQNKKTVGGEAKFSSHRTRAVASFPPGPKLLKQRWRRPPVRGRSTPRRRPLPLRVWPTRQPGRGGGRQDSRECPSAALGARRWESGLLPSAGGRGEEVGRGVGGASSRGAGLPAGAGRPGGGAGGGVPPERGQIGLVF